MKKEGIMLGLLVILILISFSFVNAESNETETNNETQEPCLEIPISKLCPDQETLCPQITDENGCPAWDCDACETTAECTDSDSGKNYYVKGITKGLLDGELNKRTDHCGGINSELLEEFYCDESNIAIIHAYKCPNGCLDGACIEEPDKPDRPDEPPYEVETCAAKIKITFDKYVYYYGDNFKFEVEISDAEGNRLANYPFSIQTYDTMPHTPENHMTDEKGRFIVEGIIDKGKGSAELRVFTAPNIKTCGPVRSSVKVEIKKGEDTEEVCGIGVCVPEKEVEDIPEDEVLYTCAGCKLEGKCYPLGYRKLGGYCSEDYNFVEQLDGGNCDNSFECKSNICVSGECVGEGLMKKIMKWFKKMFGGGEDEGDDEESGEEICNKLLIKKDIGDYEFGESGYGDSKEAQAPLYAENGEKLGSLKCCRAQYLYEGKIGGMAIICSYDSRGDVENALKWLSARGEITSGEYKGEEIYKSGGPVIVWAHKQLLIAVGGGEGPEPEMNVPLPEEVADAYLKKYKNDLKDIEEGAVPYEPEPFVFCTEADKEAAKECMNSGGNMQSDPSSFDGTQEGKERCKEYGEGCCEVYTGCTSSGGTEYRDGSKEFLVKAETLGEITLIDFETLPDGTVLQRADRLTGNEWESLGVVFEAPSEEFLKVFGPWHPFNPLDKLSLSPGFGPFEAGSDTHDDLNIIFSEPVKAAGIYLLDLGETDERESITFLDSNNDIIKKISPWPKSTFGNPAPGTFVSLIYEEGISKIEILENTQDSDDIAYDNLYFVR